LAPTKDRTWAEVSLARIAHNYDVLRSLLPVGCRFLGVVKADAYGHGALPVAHLLRELGADYLAVACLEEAVRLRAGGIPLPILIFGYTPPESLDTLLQYDLTQTIFSPDMAQAFSVRAQGRPLKVHLKLDTGMGRLGFPVGTDGALPDSLLSLPALPHLDILGVFTHFAVSDVADGTAYTNAQLEAFLTAVKQLETASGRRIPLRHCANSGAVLNHPAACLDMARPGIALYGAYENPPQMRRPLKPAMALRTRIIQCKTLRPGDSVSYGRTYTVQNNRRIAVVPIGYADGLHRSLSGKMDMLLHGKRARQIGRICMDMCMLDVTDIPAAKAGDVVTVFGPDGDGEIPVTEQAAMAGTISYELLCSVSGRVPRVYADFR